MNILISNTSQEPIYEQIIRQIKNKILNGDLVENDALPSIRSLARELQISVITTKRAYDELEKDGFINTVPGKGTYIGTKNTQILRETRLKSIEENFEIAVSAAKTLGLSLVELQEMLRLMYEED